MDREQEIRLNFLAEAQSHLDAIESNLIGLADAPLEAEKVDLMLRAAHSVKGGAGMMNFKILSRSAHRLEDFFKILRVRRTGDLIETEVEILLLRSLDILREISSENSQGIALNETWYCDRAKPIFLQLKEHLGDLQQQDEDALLSQDEGVNPALILFEEGVEAILDRFEAQLAQLTLAELGQELASTATELIAFGNMVSIKPFINLCESICQTAQSLSPKEIQGLANQALKIWRRSHALVLRGKSNKIPSSLSQANFVRDTSFDIVREEIPEFNDEETDFALASDLEDTFVLEQLTQLQSAFDLDSEDESEEIFAADTTAEFDSEIIKAQLAQLQSAFDLDKSVSVNKEDNSPQEDALNLEKLTKSLSPGDSETSSHTIPQLSQASTDKLVRVPSSQLKKFNNLLEDLILERNKINAKLKQLTGTSSLLKRRIEEIAGSNTRLKQWYDRASVEGFLRYSQQPTTPADYPSLTRQQQTFDALEMDRYSDIHLLVQEQIETIVQLEEAAKDIELDLQDMSQAVQRFNHTTKSLQNNANKTQMLPFSEVTKRFPRLIRELSLQFNKQINLQIKGENTLIDRSVIDSLIDPLMHLLRNAFDHGIEDQETRLAANKLATATISLEAKNQGTHTIITVSDDGKGISLDKIRQRLHALGYPADEIKQMSEKQLLDCIFEPGFSTAQKVTEISGRGVGMDVVRTNLGEIRGDVAVQTNLGKGTTFKLRIPFSLSILRVVIIEQAGITLAIPANTIKELLILNSKQITSKENRKFLLWQGQEISLINIEKTLAYHTTHQAIDFENNAVIQRPLVLVVGDEKNLLAMEISSFWREQDMTMRPITSPIPLTPGIISSVVYGDGRVIPLIDPVQLLEYCLTCQLTNQTTIEKSAQLAPTQANKTILVVDDSINVRRYLSLTLEKAGYQVEQAKDGQEAIDKLREGLIVAGVICDIEMPRLDGYGVLEELKSKEEFEHLPIAMLTSRSNEKHRKLAMNLGAAAYFSKPYNEQELLQTLAQIIYEDSMNI